MFASRKAALAAGHKRYKTGKPCKRGHRSERWVVNGMCMACKYEAQRLPKYREHQHDYNRSPKGHENSRRFDSTPRGLERYRRYNTSPKGRERNATRDMRPEVRIAQAARRRILLLQRRAESLLKNPPRQ